MSFKFTKIEKKNFSNEPSSELDENELDKDNSEEEKINQINNYKINNKISSMIASQNIKDKEDNSLKSSKDKIKNNLNNNRNEQIEKQNILDENYSKKEATLEQNDENKNNETQFYELTTNGLVEKIKNDYEDIYINQQNDINRFVEKLANENSELKLEISKLKTELIKLQTKNDFNSNFNLFQNENTNAETNKINNNIGITSQKIELEKKI